ncbi:ubiquinone/menaquinone biosynthesis methyltransferase UbiE [Haloarcula hispanica N601]|uniref:Ubiquinone/menaquinone biosynthesis methyltransferase UbiE n=2 Tax=Haloarcula hispanica TaxID=51589 RepID=W0GI20_HALHI|nr:class I SAM-dependent methyltransferase [Haloarcula hispanica]AEM56552.1 putative ubiquinone/menaquinone biosynthesis methyltransferase [Haloarcula hispanica ATCC 33960]AHF55861.1 ubiquinone/menaquinone biosynthesis methyltransferase UbiE [Haloarcula hispanica N601]
MDQRDVVREGYDEIASTYAEKRDGNGRERTLVESLAAALPDGSRVLDAGCGAGTPAMEVLADQHDTIGLDISAEQLRTARDTVDSDGLVRGDLATLPFADDTFEPLSPTTPSSTFQRTNTPLSFPNLSACSGPAGNSWPR